MKKLVSVLLCMAVLVCVSCKKEKNSSGISFEEDLELYHVEVINGQQSSSSEPGPEGEFTLKQDETTGKYVAKRNYPCTSYNYEKISLNGNSELDKKIQEIQGVMSFAVSSQFDEECRHVGSMSQSAYLEYESKVFSLKAVPYRADSQVASFCINGNFYNVSSESCEIIKLSEVVKNKDAFFEQIRKKIPYCSDGSVTSAMMTQYETQIRNAIDNDTLNFLICYDGIEIRMDDLKTESDPVSVCSGNLFISAIKEPDAFNTDYFGHTPKHYSVQSHKEGDGSLYWDIDADGQSDTLTVDAKDSADGNSSDHDCRLLFNGNGVDLKLKNTNPDITFAQTNDGRFVYVENYCLQVEKDGTLKVISDQIDACSVPENNQTPDEYENRKDFNFLGLEKVKIVYTLNGRHGIPLVTSTYSFGYYDSSFVSVKELKAVLFDQNTKKEGQEVTIPEGTKYKIVQYFSENKQLHFYVSIPDDKANGDNYFDAVAEYVPYDGKPGGTLNGIDIDELFVQIVG